MKKRLFRVALALCLGLTLAACQKQSPPATPEDAFRQLLAADYEVYYLIYAGGLAAEGETRAIAGADYRAVTSPDHGTIDALQKRLESTYLRSETVKAILGAKDAGGNPLLRWEDGKLWRSAAPEIRALGYEVEEDTIQLTNGGETAAAFTFRETGLDGSLYEARLSMTKTAAGWRLDAPRWEAERTLLREGSAETSLVGQGAARQAAEEFLAAITGGGLSELPLGAGMGDLSAWRDVKITSAAITQAVEEMDSQGDYIVAVTVEDGGGVFPEGTRDYRLVMRCNEMRFGDAVYPAYFRPASEQYYNWSGYVDQNQDGPGPAWYVDVFIGFYGWTTFRDPAQLPDETVVEFSLLFAQSAEGDDRYTPAELAEAVENTFGLVGFDGSGTKYYVKDQDRYLLWGRGGNLYDLLIQQPRIDGDQAQVDVTFYGDVLCTSPRRTVRYALEKGSEGSWKLLSAATVTEEG